MSSITLFYNNFTHEEELKEQLSTASNYTLLCDRDLLLETSQRFGVEQEKAERTIFGAKSIFNAFTLEKERGLAQLKIVLAEHIAADNVIICGLSSFLVSSAITNIGHILHVGVFDEKKGRIRRALAGGVEAAKQAARLIDNYDKKATEFAQLVCGKPAADRSLYDIRIAVHELEVQEIVRQILEQYHRPAVLADSVSKTAAQNFLFAAQMELTLLEKGYVTKVSYGEDEITVKVNQSSFNFTRLADSIREIVSQTASGREINVIASADCAVSIIRAQEFIPPPKILLVDDEKEFIQTLSERLITRQYASYPVFAGEEALDCLETEAPDVMVLDLKMPGMQGIEVLTKVKEVHPEIEVIILTGHGSEDDKTVCLETGAFAYLQKPVDIKKLTAVIDSAYKKVAEERLTREKQ